ncbi:EF-P lysine aminoacylase EpmA [Halioxenophilus aromaticivorans]|uniref:Elongation factor P--(R)-beta-lysine ligase n=1 Tax=Halioxenophilus aromaticivorans TaxID=1306992 RepID=A0AAV3U342_9ALTE
MTDSAGWQPSASLVALRTRAQTLHTIRQFFTSRHLLEIDVPVLASHSVTDPSITAIQATVNNQTGFLQTSPEYFLKRLIAAGYGSVFYLGKAFRDQEYGRRHQPEFTMLEWYQLGFDDVQLMQQTLALMAELLPGKPQRTVSYQALFEAEFGANPHTIDDAALAQLGQARCAVSFDQADRNTWLDLLFSHCLEPKLQDVVVVCDYPASQGALARLGENPQGHRVAKRFEVFVDGLEIGNGYWELSDADELAQRFAADQELRRERGDFVPAVDPQLMAAQRHGLPDCAGIAMGVDRIIMAKLGASSLADTLAFATHFSAEP